MEKSPINSAICSIWGEIHALAPARFAEFVHAGDADELDAFAKYIWNLELCGALYKPLHFLELAVRNAVHNALTASSGRDDWFDNPSLLRPSEQVAIKKVRADLKKQKVQATTDRIVAGLHFGFWTTLHSKPYEHRIFIPHAAGLYPHMPRRERTRLAVSKRLEDARKLRNRVFHHEPVWHFANLTERHAQIIETIRYISDSVHVAALMADSFVSVHQPDWHE